MSIFLGFVCGFPLLALWYAGLALLHHRGRLPQRFFIVAGLLPVPFIGLAIFGEVHYALTDEAIVSAACGGDVAGIEQAIAWGADPNRSNEDDGYALPCAVGNGHVAAAKALLRHKADPKLGGFFGIARDLAKQSDDPEMRRLFGMGPRTKR